MQKKFCSVHSTRFLAVPCEHFVLRALLAGIVMTLLLAMNKREANTAFMIHSRVFPDKAEKWKRWGKLKLWIDHKNLLFIKFNTGNTVCETWMMPLLEPIYLVVWFSPEALFQCRIAFWWFTSTIRHHDNIEIVTNRKFTTFQTMITENEKLIKIQQYALLSTTESDSESTFSSLLLPRTKGRARQCISLSIF